MKPAVKNLVNLKNCSGERLLKMS